MEALCRSFRLRRDMPRAPTSTSRTRSPGTARSTSCSSPASSRTSSSTGRVLGTHRCSTGSRRGNEVDTAGDGFLATFDGPARAVRCAQAIRSALRPLGIDITAGVHSGEVEVGAEGSIAGLAVHIGARVAAQAQSGEVLASSTVKDLVAGSGLEFDDRGIHKLKGVPGEWRLYAVRQ